MNKKKTWFVALLSIIVLALSACVPVSGSNSDDSKETKSSTKSSEKKEVVLRVMDWSDSSKAIREEFHKKFMAKYPNIKIEYTQLTIDQFKNTILTAVKSGEAPDLFPLPTGMRLAAVVNDGWYQPLDPYIDDDFKTKFMDGTFVEGITMLGGKIYSIPEALSQPSSLVFYNKKLFKEAGLDPDQPPKTYSEFRAAAKKITAAGKGKYYGMIEGGKQSNRWLVTVREWSALGGSGLNANSPISLVTNKATYDSKPVLDVFNLFQGLAKDGSFHPKTMSISAPEARAIFAQGQAGFIVQGAWNVSVWNKNNPDLDYGVMAPPLPDSGQKGTIPITSNSPWMGLSADSKHPKEAALYLKELYSGDYFQQERTKSGDSLSVVKGINEKYNTVEQLKAYQKLNEEYGRVIPDPSIRNPHTADVFVEFKDVSPHAGEILGGVVAGAIKDYKGELTKYSNQLQKAWDSALATAKEKGIEAKGSDFEFPNWKPMENFTTKNYEELK